MQPTIVKHDRKHSKLCALFRAQTASAPMVTKTTTMMMTTAAAKAAPAIQSALHRHHHPLNVHLVRKTH